MSILTAGRRKVEAKASRARGEPVTVLDIGTSKICCYIARPTRGRGLEVMGRGYQIADGIKAGEVIDADAVEDSIRAVLHEAEQFTGEQIREVTAVVGGGRPRSVHVRVERPLNGRAATAEDVRTALQRVREELTDPDFVVLHLVPVEMAIDGGRPLRDVRGISGQVLEILAHAVVADAAPIRNLVNCIERCHVDVTSLVASSYAAALGAAGDEELDRGCVVLDIGAGTTQMAFFAQGRLIWLDRIAKAGDRIVGDIAYGLSTSRRAAERVMNLHGSVAWRASDDNVRIEYPMQGDRDDEPSGEVSRTRLTFIIRSRMEDILRELMGRMDKAHAMLGGCTAKTMVLTGGAAQIDGMTELCEELFGIEARVGRPTTLGEPGGNGESPCCAASAGGLMLKTSETPAVNWWEVDDQPTITHGIARLREWLRQNF
ncbi:cell division protein FtsA [Arboricoccus pini]|uniref:Cell division protein FtsA n=1 Tax=Arboricoccus pini TaxID=1963835 RepID=A0A212QAX1_9PROT|nr:cell division protein FtsA [Arboricoccus pini]SNB56387.1 cell division protein FtsA [Arboricoccus pini]